METTVTVTEGTESGFFDSVLNIPAWLFGVSILGTAALAGGITYLITGGGDSISGKIELPKDTPDELKKAIKASVEPLVNAVMAASEKQPRNYQSSLVTLLMEDYAGLVPDLIVLDSIPSSSKFASKFQALARPIGVKTDTVISLLADTFVKLKTDAINAAEKNAGTHTPEQIDKVRARLRSFRGNIVHVPQAAEESAAA